MDAPEHDLSAIVANIKDLVHRKKNARGVVEDMRDVALYPPIPDLFDTLLAILQQLKADKKAGESNKAIRQAYWYLSSLAARDALGDGELITAMHQLARVDMKDELVTRQLSALMLYAEFSARYPSLETSSQCGALLSPLLAEAASAVERGAPTASSGWGRRVQQGMSAANASLAYAAMAVAAGTSVQPHGSMAKHLQAGLCSTEVDVARASACALERAAARATCLEAVAADAALHAERKASAEAAAAAAASLAAARAKSGGSGGGGLFSKSATAASSSAISGVSAEAAAQELTAAPVSAAHLASIVAAVAPSPWCAADGAVPAPGAFVTADATACVHLLRAAAMLAGIHSNLLGAAAEVPSRSGGVDVYAFARGSGPHLGAAHTLLGVAAHRSAGSRGALPRAPASLCTYTAAEHSLSVSRCYDVLLSALADKRWRVRLEAVLLLAAAGIPRLLAKAGRVDKEQSSSMAAAQASRYVVSAVGTVLQALHAGCDALLQPLVCSALHAAQGLALSFACWEAHQLQKLRQRFLAARKDADGSSSSGGLLLPSGAPGDFCATGTEPDAELLLWGSCASAMCDLADGVLKCILVAEGAQSGSSGSSGSSAAWSRVSQLATECLAWVVPAVAHALPTKRFVQDPFMSAVYCSSLLDVPLSCFQNSAACAVAATAAAAALFPQRSACLDAQQCTRAALSSLADACHRLDTDGLWQLWRAVADRALLYRRAAGPLARLLPRLSLLWLQRTCGDHSDAITRDLTSSAIHMPTTVEVAAAVARGNVRGISGSGSASSTSMRSGSLQQSASLQAPPAVSPTKSGIASSAAASNSGTSAVASTPVMRSSSLAGAASTAAHLPPGASTLFIVERAKHAALGASTCVLSSVPILKASGSYAMVRATFEVLRHIRPCGAASLSSSLSPGPAPARVPAVALALAHSVLLSTLQRLPTLALAAAMHLAASTLVSRLLVAANAAARYAVQQRGSRPPLASYGLMSVQMGMMQVTAAGPGALLGGHQYSLSNSTRHQLVLRAKRLGAWYAAVEAAAVQAQQTADATAGNGKQHAPASMLVPAESHQCSRRRRQRVVRRVLAERAHARRTAAAAVAATAAKAAQGGSKRLRAPGPARTVPRVPVLGSFTREEGAAWLVVRDAV